MSGKLIPGDIVGRLFVLVMILISFGQMAFAAKDRCLRAGNVTSDAVDVPKPKIPGLPSFVINTSILKHPIETRGFVMVPLDYNDPNSPLIAIFYRRIPSTSRSPKPTMIVINGGPGHESASYRDLEYNYGQPTEDALTNILKDFNVVLVDQRGTIEGASFPLNVDSPNLRQELIARYMNPDFLALDHDRVAQELLRNQIIGSRSQYFLMGHSFGGWVGASFIRLAEENRIGIMPAGTIFSAGNVLLQDPLQVNISARRALERANLAVEEFSVRNRLLPFSRLVQQLEQNFAALGFTKKMAHYVYPMLLGATPKETYSYAQRLLRINSPQQVQSFMEQASEAFDPVALVVRVQSIYGGQSAAEYSARGRQAYPLPDWMIDPEIAQLVDATYNNARSRELSDLISTGRIPTQIMPTLEQLRNFSRRTRLLLHSSTNDIVVGGDANYNYVVEHLGKSFADSIFVVTNSHHQEIRTTSGMKVIRDFFGL